MMRVRYMLDDEVIAERQLASLPFAGDRQYLRTVQQQPFRVKYTLAPIPGHTLAIVGLDRIA